MIDPSARQPVVKMSRPADHVALVTLSRPEARNAVNAELSRQMEATVESTEADPAVRVVVLTGEGPTAFCAGADLKVVSAGGLDSLFTAKNGFAGFNHARRDKPWIAAVNGYALAGGCEMALACDMVVAAQDAMFGLPEVRRGLIASTGGLYRLTRAVPRNVALELIATGGQISAARAHELGLVNRLAPAGEAVGAALALAAEIAVNAPLAVRESLAVARLAMDLDETELRRAGDEAQRRIMATEDFREGPRAFVEKRSPTWVGR
jgi:enoyl-CoA hydratase/carnithine racemase